jgi:hypothetical protein
LSNYIILKKIPQSPASSDVRALPNTVKSKVSFFLFLSSTTNVYGVLYGVQLSKKDDIDCDIGWANPRVIK